MQEEWNEIPAWRRDIDKTVVGGLERFLAWFARHWLLLINFSVGLVIAVSILDPYLMSIGLSAVGVPIFRAYRLVCTQIPGHSYWPFGFQMAMCQRDLAIFSSFLLGGIAFWAMRRNWGRLHWRWYVIMSVPIAIDGFTQLFGLRHSTWELRTFTGGLFGIASALAAFPLLQWAMHSVEGSLQANANPSQESAAIPTDNRTEVRVEHGQ